MEKYLEFLPEDIVNKISLYNSHPIADLFKKEFTVIGVSNFNLVDPILVKTKCNIFYITKAGENEGQISKVCKTVVPSTA